MLSPVDLAWIAGIVEGEGHIFLHQVRRKKSHAASVNVGLAVNMTDLDIIQRLANYWHGAHISVTQPKGIHRKTLYRVDAAGAGWLMTLYPLLGHRRRERIRHVLTVWRHQRPRGKYRTHCPAGHLYAVFGRVNSKGGRFCPPCRRAQARKRYQSRPAARRIAEVRQLHIA